MKRKVDTKKLVIGCGAVFVLVIAIAILSGTRPKQQLSEKYDQALVIEEAKRAVDYFNERDYQSIIDMGCEEFVSANTAENMAEQNDIKLDTYGAFVKYQSEEAIGGTNPETGEEYGGALITVLYKNNSVTFSIGFNEDMELRQFLIQ